MEQQPHKYQQKTSRTASNGEKKHCGWIVTGFPVKTCWSKTSLSIQQISWWFWIVAFGCSCTSHCMKPCLGTFCTKGNVLWIRAVPGLANNMCVQVQSKKVMSKAEPKVRPVQSAQGFSFGGSKFRNWFCWVRSYPGLLRLTQLLEKSLINQTPSFRAALQKSLGDGLGLPCACCSQCAHPSCWMFFALLPVSVHQTL